MAGAAVHPLVVDLDGTLIRTDVTWQATRTVARTRPDRFIAAAPLLAFARAAYKRRIGLWGSPDVAALPWRRDVCAFLVAQKAAGRVLHLATGADSGIAHAVAHRLGLFEHVWSSDGRTNLVGRRKAALLCDALPGGFAYAGDSAADLHVWRRASSAVLVGVSARVARKVRACGVPVEVTFPCTPIDPDQP